ncbi:MAG: hypothetical protein EHM20_07195 [Alphaproteobacteria bacterium]|nr:MAG: hypothetical protein EHM20_07195 [Alphaproteobacteria bacterium]
MSIDYAWEKLNGAVVTLASSTDSLKDRLISAFMYDIAHIRTDELPDSIKRKITDLHEEIDKENPNAFQGSIETSINAMDLRQQKELANKIVSAYDAATRLITPLE